MVVLPLLLCCRMDAGVSTRHAHHKVGNKKGFTKAREIIVRVDPIILKVSAAPAPLLKGYRFAELVKSSRERKGCSRIKQSKHNF